MSDPFSAVLADRWPLVRAGLSVALGEAGIEVVAEVETPGDAFEAAQSVGVSIVVVTAERPADLFDVVERLRALEPAPVVVVLIDGGGRDELTELVGSGAGGVFLRTAATEELTAAIPKLLAGERVLSPALVGAVVGALNPRNDGPSAGKVTLTPKERQVLRRLADGASNREIGATLFLAPATVKSHLQNIYGKLDVSDRAEAIRRALELGLI